MDLLLKSDLKFSYSWVAVSNDNPKFFGKPDNTLFNRNEGYEVLYLINKFAEMYSLHKKSSGIHMEYLIHNYLPSNCRNQEDVCAWVYTNWRKYA